MFGDPKRKERKIEKEASEGAGKKMNGKEEKAARALKEWEATAVETKKEASEEAEEALEAEKKRKQI